jgi:hypothetical protein
MNLFGDRPVLRGNYRLVRYNNLLLSALENRGYKKMFLWSKQFRITSWMPSDRLCIDR